MEAVSPIDKLAERFSGIDIQRRSQWSPKWRARIVTSKNERAEYRAEVYADTHDEAVSKLLALVEAIDQATP